MNIKQARAKLVDVMRSTGTKHPKVLVSELCAIVKFLLDEVDRIQSSCDEAAEPTSVFPRKDVDLDKRPIKELPRITTAPPPNPQKPWPDAPKHHMSGYIPQEEHKGGNAGNAE